MNAGGERQPTDAGANESRFVTWAVLAMAVIVAAVGVIVWGFWDDYRRKASWQILDGWKKAAAWLAAPTVLGVTLCAAVWFTTGGQPQWGKLGVSVVTYPFYALLQLLAFVGYVPPRLRDLHTPRWAIAPVVAVLFALVHWPNGPLMVGCLVGALLWATVHQRYGGMVSAAVSMGILGASYNYLLPIDLTSHMRTGPIFTQRIADEQRRNRELLQQIRRSRQSAVKPGDAPRRSGE